MEHVHELATHPFGCRVLQKAFENLDLEMKRALLDEMHETCEVLMEDQFGSELLLCYVFETRANQW